MAAPDNMDDELIARLLAGYALHDPIVHNPAPKPLLFENRQRLSRLLDELVRAQNWKEASGVLGLLLKGTPHGSTFWEDRRNFRVAMEIVKRLGDGRSYHIKIKQIFEIWMGKLAWLPKNPKKKDMIHLELALFYISEGNTQEAHNIMKFLIKDNVSAEDPTVDLVQGMILFQLWYSSLPSQLQINVSDVDMTSETSFMAPDNVYEENAMSLSLQNATDIRDIRCSSRLDSESSVKNEDVVIGGKKSKMQEQSGDFHIKREFDLSGSDINVDEPPEIHHQYLNSSIFFAHGLEKVLLPVNLNELNTDYQTISQYRNLANEQYNNAVKHLKFALDAEPSLHAALLPLVQLLLLGDHVEEALRELEVACRRLDTSLPFRLKGRILECFHSNKVSIISNCYENALQRDPACSMSLERLIKMHKNGNYSTSSLLEKVVSYLDAADGNSIVWEELASLLLALNNDSINDSEDRVSLNTQGGSSGIMASKVIVGIFIEGHTREIWEYRCRWWMNRHFSKDAYVRELESGDYKLLAAKAACASHLYGRKFGYVKAVYSSLPKEGHSNLLMFLAKHMQTSRSLSENLNIV